MIYEYEWFFYDPTQVTILRKIRRNSQESFTGKSGENAYSYSEEFLATHSEEPGPKNFLSWILQLSEYMYGCYGMSRIKPFSPYRRNREM